MNLNLDESVITSIATSNGWSVIPVDRKRSVGMLSFRSVINGKAVRINVWNKKGTVAIQTGGLQMYKKWCEYDELNAIFKNEGLGEKHGFKIVRQG